MAHMLVFLNLNPLFHTPENNNITSFFEKLQVFLLYLFFSVFLDGKCIKGLIYQIAKNNTMLNLKFMLSSPILQLCPEGSSEILHAI